MKKIIVALVLALGLVTVATGCSDSKPTTKK
jgi:predicted component of type VI protein secretion system